MNFAVGQLREQLAALATQAAPPRRYILAFSGGLDSTVLAHALVHADTGVPIVAIHIDHGLHENSREWGEHCALFADSLGIEYRCRNVTVQLESGKGPEASAREARYTALHAELQHGDWLLSAHHQEDQAETLLLNLVRGSGPAGIAGIGAIRRFGPGWLARPLLDTDRAALEAYAEKNALQWVEDPSNTDRRFDRNFLRHEILPRLKSRWPDIAARLQRSASHAGEAAALLADLADIDLAGLGGQPERLSVDGLLGLPRTRQKNLIRHALRLCGLSTPTALQLDRILTEVLPAREDAQPHVSWPGASVRRYRNGLYLLPEILADAPEAKTISGDQVVLGAGLGMLRFEPGAGTGIAPTLFERGLRLDVRQGGEEIQPLGQRHTRKLKKLLQEAGVVPWMRDRLPLVYAGEQLVAVGDLWIETDAVSKPGVAIHWTDRPALY
ncbi:MAG: tRNA lysidine(34) synthetase TilS [Woeseiaceae bacterium]|nr:tRNA lysidine(34) synthetase TilS [Woeseiaceae bacterium]